MRRMGRKDRRRGGYTMAEILIVVAILGVLAGIAIPSIISYRRALKLTELDDNARTIYLAAQNHLSALHSASGGTLETGEAVDRGAADVPDGAVPGVDSAAGTAMKYVSTDVTGAQPGWLVLPGAVDGELTKAGSHYLVEFDPASGVVYGVFYTEDSDGKALNQSVYQDLYSFTSGGKSCRVREGREAFATSSGGFLVGYYGADGALDLSRLEGEEMPTPKIKLTNNEELVLEFSAEEPDAEKAERILYSVSVTGPDKDGTERAKTLVANGSFSSGATNVVVLDTLKSGYSKDPGTLPYGGWTVGSSFADWVKEPDGKSIVPGANITVSVTTWYQPDADEGVSALPKTATVTTNSLFGQRVDGEVDGKTQARVEVGYGRHLQNLNAAGLDSAITQAVQVRDIDFEAATPAVASDQREHWMETYGTRVFVPIENANLTRFDGGGRLISNLNAVAQSNEKNAGLFETLNGVTVEQVTLVDARARANGTMKSAGALAGEATGSSLVKDCQVYITAEPGGTYSADARIFGENAGGLIGWAKGCTVENSFASTVAQAKMNAGGLVGRSGSGNLNVNKSYAASRLSGPRVGGLVGGGDGVKLTDSYAAGLMIPDAGGTAAGLCGMEVTSATRCYAAADYNTVDGETYTIYGAVPSGTCTDVFYLPKYGVNDAVEVTNVTLVASSDVMVKAKTTEGGTSEPGALAALTTFKNGPLAKAYPYNHVTRTEEEGGPLAAPYPYPTLGDLPHYGDWLVTLVPPKPECLIVYYEQFQIGGVGDFLTECSYTINGVEQGTLDLTRTWAINAEGYAFLSKEKLQNDWETTAPLTVTVSGVETRTTTVQGTYMGPLGEDLGKAVNGTEPAYYAYAIPHSAIEVAPNGGYYVDVTIKATSNIINQEPVEVETAAWFNPLFSRSAYNGTKPSSAPSVIHIRSLRQLENIAHYYGDPNYVQDLDIDGQIYVGYRAANWNGPAIYNAGVEMNAANHVTIGGFEVWGRGRWTPGWGYATDMWNRPEEYHLIVSPIGGHDTPGGEDGGYDVLTSFHGTYDGNGRIIRAVSIRPIYHAKDGVYYTGLFYRVIGGKLKNITLQDCDVIGAFGTGNDSTGTLLGRLSSSGQVVGCTVEDCTITVAPEPENTKAKAGGHVGGMIGYMDNGDALVQDCTVRNVEVDGGSGAFNVGGFLGAMYKIAPKSGSPDGGAIRNCTAKDVTVSGGYVGKDKVEKATSQEKVGTAAGFVGCLKQNSGVLDGCSVIGTGGLSVSGGAQYTGGFVGIMVDNDDGKVENCAVRLEGTPGKHYESQGIEGGKAATGGFAGAMLKGSVTASYASVKVAGANVGGFIGELHGGSVSNSYSGGRTKNARYTAALPNVSGTGQTGGFVGLWKGGSLNVCYTTCAVSGPNDGATDVFANRESATLNSPVSGCYALGTAFVAGANRGSGLNEANVATTRPVRPAEERTETHAYDTSLREKYPYAPVKDAAGNPIPHYGDWPEDRGAPREFEWQPVPDPMPESNMDYVQNVEAQWVGEELTVTIETIGSGTTLANIFKDDGGTFAITSDLGYTRALSVTDKGDGTFTIGDGMGHAWTVKPVESYNKDGELIRSYTFTLPSSLVPTYEETIGIGGFLHGTMIDGIKNDDPGATENKPTKPFLPGDSVVIDGKFEDWAGYSHQPLAYGGTDTAARTAIGAAFGDDSTIYLHVKNGYTLVDTVPFHGTLVTTPLFQGIDITVEGDPEWGWTENRIGTITSLTAQTYTGPGMYLWTRTVDGETETLGQAYIKINDDGSQEMEMVIYLHMIAGQEVADKIDNFVVKFTAIGGSTLTIERDLTKKQQ